MAFRTLRKIGMVPVDMDKESCPSVASILPEVWLLKLTSLLILRRAHLTATRTGVRICIEEEE